MKGDAARSVAARIAMRDGEGEPARPMRIGLRQPDSQLGDLERLERLRVGAQIRIQLVATGAGRSGCLTSWPCGLQRKLSGPGGTEATWKVPKGSV